MSASNAAETAPEPPRGTGRMSPGYPLALLGSLLAAPLFSLAILRDAHDGLASELKVVITAVGLGVLVLPLLYISVLLTLARWPEALARGFQPLVIACLGALAALMIAEGVLLVLALYALEFPGTGSARRHEFHFFSLDLTAWIYTGFGALTFILAGVATLGSFAALRRGGALECTGVVVTDELPQLRARVARIAARLGVTAPPRVIVGLEPCCFVSAAPVALRGGETWAAAETLYLPLLALRVFTGAELDAVIGHELAHFRAGDVYFTQRFGPAMHALRFGQYLFSLPAEGLANMVKLPGVAISGMLLLADRISAGISRERELAADRAGAEAASGADLIAVLLKLGVLDLAWHHWSHLNDPKNRLSAANDPAPEVHDNLVQAYLGTVQTLLATAGKSWLRERLLTARIPHPLDTHPILSQRAAALGVDTDAVLRHALWDLQYPRETERCPYLEIEVTFLERKFGAPDEREVRGGPPSSRN